MPGEIPVKACSTHLAEGASELVTVGTEVSSTSACGRKYRMVNSSTLKARKGEPVSPIGDVTEMRKLILRRVSRRFSLLPAEIALPCPALCERLGVQKLCRPGGRDIRG